MINSVKLLQAVDLQWGGVKIQYRSQILRNRDVTDGATALGKEVGVFEIARRETDKTSPFRYKQKSENRYDQTDNL